MLPFHVSPNAITALCALRKINSDVIPFFYIRLSHDVSMSLSVLPFYRNNQRNRESEYIFHKAHSPIFLQKRRAILNLPKNLLKMSQPSQISRNFAHLRPTLSFVYAHPSGTPRCSKPPSLSSCHCTHDITRYVQSPRILIFPISRQQLGGGCQRDVRPPAPEYNSTPADAQLERRVLTRPRAPGTAESAPAPTRTVPRCTWCTCQHVRVP